MIVQEDSFRVFPSISFTQSKGFVSPLVVQFITSLNGFEEEYGSYLREELEIDGNLRVSSKDLNSHRVKPNQTQDSFDKILFVLDRPNKDQEKYEEFLGKTFKKIKSLKFDRFDMTIPSGINPYKLGFYTEVLNYFFIMKNSLGISQYLRIEHINIVTEIEGLVESEDFKFYHIVGKSKNLSRDFCNGRANQVGVERFLDDARERVAKQADDRIKVTIIQGEDLLKERLNLIHAVGKGSCQKPALLNLAYTGNSPSTPYFSLIGKGIVFDQGGTDCKLSQGIWEMFGDKGGACNVYACFWAVVAAGLPVNLTVTVGLAENVVSGTAYRTSDIITSHAGLTVEVKNTDAEGRLVLADAMSWTQDRFACSHMVELSTLTGAITTSLKDIGGVFSNDKDFGWEIVEVAREMSERMHLLPIRPVCREAMKGKISDLKNSALTTVGGAILAAAFLERFVKTQGLKWVHMDIAAANMVEESTIYTQVGCVGFGVGTIMEYLRRFSRNETG